MTAGIPAGFRIILDSATKQLAHDKWFGGSPARVLRLTPAGQAAWLELRDGPVASVAGGALARRLTDAGLAHPCPPQPPAKQADIIVVIPVRDRPEMLARCLGGLDKGYRVIVVDDGSRDPAAVASVARHFGATLVRRTVNGGPAAARNTALELVDTELVALIDSDCVPSPDWIDQLAAHLADPLVAAVAPRIVELSSMGDGAAPSSGLDLGDRPARVVPNTRLSFVPSAALVIRRAALADVARAGRIFDEALRVGEDVDLVWRLHEAGWRVRYDPSVRIGHHEPQTRAGLLSRRFRYGTSAAALARRHPKSIPPLVLQPWPTVTVVALLQRRPVVAALAFGVSVLSMIQLLHRHGVPTDGVWRAMLTAVHQTWLGIGHYGVQYAAPVLAGMMAVPGRRGRRIATGSLLFGPALTAWVAQRPGQRLAPFVLRKLADDIAYGCGVWAGCVRHRTGIPLYPRIAWRPLRVEPPDKPAPH